MRRQIQYHYPVRANRLNHGPQASVALRDELHDQVCRTIEAGAKCILGGVKRSGYGRELSRFGIHEFVNIKTSCVNNG